MATKFDYTKLVVENIGKIIPAVILIVTGLTSAFGWVLTDNWQKDDQRDQAVREVAIGFQQAMAVEKKINVSSKRIVIIKKCDGCLEEVEKLRKEFHE